MTRIRNEFATTSQRCECGKRKTPTSIQCRSCAFLDGVGDTQRAVIDALHDLDGATVSEIADATGAVRNSVDMALIRLRDKGRVARRWSDHLEAYVHWAVTP